MRTGIWLCCLVLAVSGCSNPEPGPEGGRFAATGFFRVECTGTRDWLVTPAGEPFISLGVNRVDLAGDRIDPEGNPAPDIQRTEYESAALAKYGSEESWADSVVAHFAACRLNTIGNWSRYDLFQGRLPYTVSLEMGRTNWVTGEVSDYFDPAWVSRVWDLAAAHAAPLAGDPRLLGYFTDNELRWGRDHRAISRELLDDYLSWPAQAPGKQVAVAFLEDRYDGRIADFNAAWGTHFASFSELLNAINIRRRGDRGRILADQRSFLTQVAEQYFEVTTAAIRAFDPNHLILGYRAMSVISPPEVVRVAGRYVEVMSVNAYVYAWHIDRFAYWFFGPVLSADDFLAEFAAESGRPILVTEFGFRAADSGMPNTWPPIYPVYPTQTQRADAFEACARAGLAKPYVVGLHWFQYTDQPREGRFYDGEDNNFGLVDLHDDPYVVLLDRMRDVYGELLAATGG